VGLDGVLWNIGDGRELIKGEFVVLEGAIDGKYQVRGV
jgi:hypothetical protein